jgi:NlpC/P60 family
LLQPLTAPPEAISIPLSRPSRPDCQETPASKFRQRLTTQNTIEPRSFIQLVIAKVRRAHYALGASLQNGPATDCSGFTRYIYRLCRINLPRSSAEQAQVGKLVARSMDFSKLRPGDLLFFRDGGHAVGHTGIYLGDGKMIHASKNAGGVVVSELNREYYVDHFVVARRILKKQYRWPVFPGLSPADRYRDWNSPVLTPSPAPRPLPSPLPKPLLKIFWPRVHLNLKPQA